MMGTLRQIFFDNRATTGTSLSSVFGVNPYDTSASVRRFARGVLYKSPPGYIRDALVNSSIAVCLHPVNIQLLKHNQAVAIDQLPAFLMSEVITPVFDASVNVVKSFNGPMPLRTSLSQLARFTLDALQVLFVSLHPTLAFNCFTIRERGESGQTQVNPDHFRTNGQRLWFNFARKAGVPVTQRIALNSKGFNLAFDGPMQHDSNVAYFGQSQVVIFQLKARLLEGETIIPAKAFVSRKAILMAFSNPAKQRLESQINSLLNNLQNLRVNVSQFGIVGLPAGQFLIGIIQAQ
jgi:hypothetical protein